MYRIKPLLLTFLALFLVGLAATAHRPLIAAYRQRRTQARPAPRPKPASAVVPTVVFKNGQRDTPGQLTLLDKKGQPAGVCPLKHTDVRADVSGFVSRVTVTQQFFNPTHQPVEAVYSFPLPGDAAVDDMTMTLGQRLIKGEIKRREEARQIYDAAKAAGQAASLLDQERPNIFTQSVANLMPGDSITITISYVNLLKYTDGQYEFVFPMVVGPRYIPNGGGYTVPGKRGDPSPKPGEVDTLGGPVLGKPVAPVTRSRRTLTPGFTPPAPSSDGLPPRVVTDADKITPPITPKGTRAGHDISVTVKIDAGMPLGPVTSVLHAVDVKPQGPNGAVVELKDQASIPNKDFILRYTAAGSEMKTGILTHADGDGNGFFTLILQPPARPAQAVVSPKEMVFVIDQTGSQSGWPIQKSKETMKYALRHMNPRDTFQLIGFNTDVYPCFPQPVPNTPANVQAALKFLEPIEGGGGTDILKSVDYALKLPADPNQLRIVCYLTDGYVGNDMQIIDYVQKHRGEARMFPIGIGNGVNRFLIDGMAKEGRGQADYVTLEEDGNKAAQRFYNKIASPVLLDPQADFSGLPVAEVYPQHIPDVFSSGPVILKGRYTRAAEGDVIVRGVLRGQPWSERVHVKLPAVDKDGSALKTVWARERIEELQSQDWMGAQSGAPNPDLTKQIIQTALDYRLMSQYTSFVAVEQRVINVNGKPRRLDVPVEMPEGVSYEGIFGEREEARVLALGVSAGLQGASVGRGFGGTVRGRMTSSSVLSAIVPPALQPASPPVAGKPALSASNAPVMLKRKAEALSELDAAAVTGRADLSYGIMAGDKEASQRLKDMKPEERRQLLADVKLDPQLHELAEKLKGKTGAVNVPGVGAVTNGKVTVLVRLNALPKDGLKRLKALGFDLNATITPNKVLLGTLPVAKLDDLLELEFVRRVEPPQFK